MTLAIFLQPGASAPGAKQPEPDFARALTDAAGLLQIRISTAIGKPSGVGERSSVIAPKFCMAS